MKSQSSALGYLVLAFHRIFEDLTVVTIHHNRRCLERKFLSIAVELLEQCSTHAKGDVVGRPPGAIHRSKRVLDRPIIHSISLNHPHLGIEYSETFAVGLISELAAQYVENFQYHV